MGCCASSPNEPARATKQKTDKEVRVMDERDLSPGKIEERYSVTKEIGRGAFSIVSEAVDNSSQEKVAIKEIEKKFVDKDSLKLLSREIDIMKKVDHVNVLKLLAIFENDTHLYLVTELIDGGELFYQIVDRGYFDEEDAKEIIRQTVDAVEYLHKTGIAHRDLKPENILCTTQDKSMVIKIADFGLSKVYSSGEALETSCGTPDYAAPEVLKMEGTYDEAVDMWSVGVVTYVLLCGFPPFYAKSQAELFDKIMNADYDFPDPEWTNISDEAKDFVEKLLVVDTQKRYTAKQLLKHPWIKNVEGKITAKTKKSESQSNITNLADYNKKRAKGE